MQRGVAGGWGGVEWSKWSGVSGVEWSKWDGMVWYGMVEL